MDRYDLVIVGGGFGGSSLATVMARAGYRCLVLEKTRAFADRTKGEWIAPWGVAEAQRLGLYDDIARARGHVLSRHARFGPDIDPDRSVAEALPLDQLPGVAGPLTQRHPDVCQVLFDAATAAGAHTRRGITDAAVELGHQPTVAFTLDGHTTAVSARLVVAADGRNSAVRRQLGLTLHHDTPHHLFSGLLVDGADGWPADLQMTGTQGDVHFLAFPQGHGRVRLYLGFALDRPRFLAGREGPQRFIDAFALDCLPFDTLHRAQPVSPCATYPNESSWVEDPVTVPGVALVADAAGWDDPITGQGLSISLRDTRVLGELLRASDDWSPAALAPYAAERTERMRRLRFASGLTAALYNEFGPDADARRVRFAERASGDRSLGAGRHAAFVGPDALPAEAFSAAEWDRALAPG